MRLDELTAIEHGDIADEDLVYLFKISETGLARSKKLTVAELRALLAPEDPPSEVGAVGTYAILRNAGGLQNPPGHIRAGSTLRYSGAVRANHNPSADENRTLVADGGTPSGTWRLMGSLMFTGTTMSRYDWAVSLFLRIA